MQHDVGAVRERTLQHRCGEGVVDDGQQAFAAGDGGHGGDVDQAQVRIGRGLEVDGARLGADGRSHGFRAGEVGEHRAHAEARQALREQREGRAVHNLVDHDFVAALQQREQSRRNGRHAGGGHHAGLRAFQRREPRFEQRLRRVARAAVHVALPFSQADLVEGLDTVLGIRGGQVERRRQRALLVQRVVAQVDGARGEAVLRNIGHLWIPIVRMGKGMPPLRGNQRLWSARRDSHSPVNCTIDTRAIRITITSNITRVS
ncbi:hypothetical protein D9M68_733780 [compost metagenome]